ncbi:Mitochondrial carnitine/acylcarnitine carrier [Seminavis robusta]|uniref:Mitochondrial carnitine/acylcarnitine carrier n=1 Tax=Seminavis robusta TaxID=568900 RepID=A0A9N8HYZ4_9STRA|nr:Mitochondrial carnitine/acylcarnitine carrier [Seminavis robusta]|eukprot:Sro2125_g315660.1 Mitochondrial carnitine/acylcarnitine carrier (298) ;mRNA; r:8419-9573
MTSASDPRAVTRDIFSALTGSVCCCYTGHPFDTVKVRMQTKPVEYPSVATTVTSILRNEGVPALWKGAVPTALGMAAENAMAFGVNEWLTRAFPDKEGEPTSLMKPFACGAFTGFMSALVLLPSDVIKAKTQVVSHANISSQQILKEMIRRQGYKSLFVGLDAEIAREVTFYAPFFGGYKMFCYLFSTHVPSMPEELNYFISGGLAGMLGWVVAMPFDVPKTNLQSRYDTKVVGSYFPELARIARERGVQGLYAGLGPVLLRAFPANAALFLGVEMGKRAFDKALWRDDRGYEHMKV